MKTTLKLIAWLVCFLLAVDISFGLLNESSTMANIVGCFALGASVAYSVNTKCFTQFKKKKNEEDNQVN